MFPVGSRIGDFFTTEEQQGKYNTNTDGYDYELKFSAYYWLWANKLLSYVMSGVTNAPKETSFSLTASIDVHASIILRALNALGFTYNNSPFRVDTDADVSTEAKYIQYGNMSILGGIQAIAEAYECEWWVERNAIHFGKCHAIGEYDFTVGYNVSAITPSNTSKKGNRLYVFGSDRNLPPNYRAVDGSDVVDAIVTRRLMLPAGTPYLQIADNIPEDQIVEEEVVFDKVYPRTQLIISNINTYTSQTENGKSQTFYRINYGNSFHFLKEYILPDEELHIVFESGDLNGMDFAVKFNPLGVGEKMDDGSVNPTSQMLEIVVNEDYGRELPDTVLHPNVGDKFILHGWDATKMVALGLIAAAEQELLTEGNKEVEERKKDLNTYTCQMMWDWCKSMADSCDTPKLGSTVNLHFAAGDAGRKSRIIGFEHDLDIPYSNVTYTCGEKVSVSRLKTLESKVEGLAHDGSKAKIQNSLDFLSKRYSDRTPYRLATDTGFEAGTFTAGLYNGTGAFIDGQGNAEFESVRVRSALEVLELIINRLSAREAEELFTESDTIESWTLRDDGTYDITVKEQYEGYFTAMTPGTVCKGIVNTLAKDFGVNGAQSTAPGKYYTSWFRVNSVNAPANSMNVSLYADTDVPGGRNYPPCELMTFARWGHQTDTTRQSCFMISSTDGRIVHLTGVTKPIIDKSNWGLSLGVTPEWLRNLELTDDNGQKYNLPLNPDYDYLYARGIVVQDLVQVDHQGKPKAEYIYRGMWDTNVTDYCHETWRNGFFEVSRVTCHGCVWQCMKSGTRQEPSWNSTDWAFVEGNSQFTVDFAEGYQLYDLNNFNATLTIVAMLYNQDVTDALSVNDIEWTRYSEYADGTPRVNEDNLWSSQHASTGTQLILTRADLDVDNGYMPKTIRFTATVTWHDGQTQTIETTIGG